MPICRPTDGGEPLCRLGQCASESKWLNPKTIEVRGTSLYNVMVALNSGGDKTHIEPLPVKIEGAYDLMVVNEAPSKEDDSVGLPMQNEAGAKLIEFVTKAGFDPRRVFITNIVRCKPPKRKPAVPEINTCKDAHLIPEIRLIKPKVIMTLGTIALRLFNLGNKGGINAIHGKLFELPLPKTDDPTLYKVIPSFNPFMFMIKPNPKLEQRVQQDYHNAAQVIKGEKLVTYKNAEFRVCDTVEKVRDLVDEVRKAGMFAFDTESPRLKWKRNPLMCISMSWGYPKKSAVIPFYKHDPNSPENDEEFRLQKVFNNEERADVCNLLRPLFEDETIPKAAHNIKYDVQVIRYWCKILTKGFWFDTMVMHHVLNEEPSHRLEDLADEEFAYGDYGQPVRDITGHGKELRHGYDWVPDEILWPYTATDSEATWRLCDTYFKRLNEKSHLWGLYEEEAGAILKPLSEAEWFGAGINVEVTKDLLNEYEENQRKLLSKMQSAVSPEFNPLSNPQVKEAFTALGYADKLKDPKSASGFSANKKILMEIQDEVELASHILEYRTNRKMISTYLKNAIKDIDADGRLRHSWLPLTVTGRLSCRFFHQIPKIDIPRWENKQPVMRDMLEPQKGYLYVAADYSQVELRIIAIIAEDQAMLDILNDPNGDLHAETTYLFLKDYIPGYSFEKAKKDKFNRTEVGKRINFAIAYGSQGHALVKTGKWKDINGTERGFNWQMLETGLKAWKDRFVGVGKYIDETPDMARRMGGIVRSKFDRERRLGARLNSPDQFLRGEAEREAINFGIQSAAGAITNRTIIMVYNFLEDLRQAKHLREDDVFLVNTVHDSVIYEVREPLVEWFENALRQIGERPISHLDNNAFKMDIGHGINWTEAEMAA